MWRNALIEIDNNRIVSGGSGKVTIVNTITYQIEAVIATDKNIQRIFSMIKLRDGSLLCGCENGWFYQIDMKKYKFKFIKEKMHELTVVFCTRETDHENKEEFMNMLQNTAGCEITISMVSNHDGVKIGRAHV